MPEPTAKDAASWMVEHMKERQGFLDQETAAFEIHKRFGEQFTRINVNGNLAIAPPVLTAFNKATGDEVVWVRSERHWRFRNERDQPGRQQP